MKPNLNPAEQLWDNIWQRGTTCGRAEDLYDQLKFTELERILPTAGTTLEVGCGTARVSAHLAARGYEAICLDESRVAFDRAAENFQARGAPARFILGDALALPIKSDSIDVVMSWGLLEHFSDPQPIVSEMVRVLKPNGLFVSDVIFSPEKFSIPRTFDFLKVKLGIYKKPWGYESNIRKTDVMRILERNRLAGIRVFGFGVFPPAALINRSGRAGQSVIFKMAPVWQSLNATFIADLWGVSIFAYGFKRG